MGRRRLLTAIAAGLALTGALTVSGLALHRGLREAEMQLAAQQAERDQLRRAVATAGIRIAALQGELASTAAALREREARLASLDRRVSGAERELRAGERLLREYAGGVALIEATVRYEDREGRPLRYRDVEGRRPWRGVLGPPPVGVDGEGPVVTTTFLGTGFLVDRHGTVLTTRHVARPWERGDETESFDDLGVEPRLADLRAFFPALPDPVPLSGGQVSEAADIMRLTAALPRTAVPILPLDATPAVPGRPVIVFGYPTGLALLLARIDPAALRSMIPDDVEAIADDTVDIPRLLSDLARARLIRPYASWGHVVEAGGHLLTYDGRTAMGASGGPILNMAGRVVGVNQAMLPDFDAVAFGVPIRHGIQLLRGRSVSR
jgi:hypothetical protein